MVRGDAGNLSPNKRMHFRTKAARVKAWREAAAWIAKELKWPETPRRVRLDWTIRRYCKTDHFNAMASLALKACEDGLVDAKIVPDDCEKYVEWGWVKQETGAKRRFREEIQIEITVL